MILPFAFLLCVSCIWAQDYPGPIYGLEGGLDKWGDGVRILNGIDQEMGHGGRRRLSYRYPDEDGVEMRGSREPTYIIIASDDLAGNGRRARSTGQMQQQSPGSMEDAPSSSRNQGPGNGPMMASGANGQLPPNQVQQPRFDAPPANLPPPPGSQQQNGGASGGLNKPPGPSDGSLQPAQDISFDQNGRPGWQRSGMYLNTYAGSGRESYPGSGPMESSYQNPRGHGQQYGVAESSRYGTLDQDNNGIRTVDDQQQGGSGPDYTTYGRQQQQYGGSQNYPAGGNDYASRGENNYGEDPRSSGQAYSAFSYGRQQQQYGGDQSYPDGENNYASRGGNNYGDDSRRGGQGNIQQGGYNMQSHGRQTDFPY